MNADGTKAGYDLEMTAAVSSAVRIPVVASGGAGSPEDMLKVLTQGKADAALAASIFHFREHSVGGVKKYLGERGVNVRINLTMGAHVLLLVSRGGGRSGDALGNPRWSLSRQAERGWMELALPLS